MSSTPPSPAPSQEADASSNVEQGEFHIPSNSNGFKNFNSPSASQSMRYRREASPTPGETARDRGAEENGEEHEADGERGAPSPDEAADGGALLRVARAGAAGAAEDRAEAVSRSERGSAERAGRPAESRSKASESGSSAAGSPSSSSGGRGGPSSSSGGRTGGSDDDSEGEGNAGAGPQRAAAGGKTWGGNAARPSDAKHRSSGAAASPSRGSKERVPVARSPLELNRAELGFAAPAPRGGGRASRASGSSGSSGEETRAFAQQDFYGGSSQKQLARGQPAPPPPRGSASGKRTSLQTPGSQVTASGNIIRKRASVVEGDAAPPASSARDDAAAGDAKDAPGTCSNGGFVVEGHRRTSQPPPVGPDGKFLTGGPASRASFASPHAPRLLRRPDRRIFCP